MQCLDFSQETHSEEEQCLEFSLETQWLGSMAQFTLDVFHISTYPCKCDLREEMKSVPCYSDSCPASRHSRRASGCQCERVKVRVREQECKQARQSE
jgi:hypothetical protein